MHALLKIAASLLLSHTSVARTSADHYRVADVVLTTNACTVNPAGLSASIEHDAKGRAWLAWRDASGEVESDPCMVVAAAVSK